MLPLRFVYAKTDTFAIQSNRVLNSQRVFKRSNNISPCVSEILMLQNFNIWSCLDHSGGKNTLLKASRDIFVYH